MNSFTYVVNLGLPLLAKPELLTKRAYVLKRKMRDDGRVLSNITWFGGKNSSYISPTIGSPVIQ